MNTIEAKGTGDVFEVIGEVRPPKDGEYYVENFDSVDYQVRVACHDFRKYEDFIIVKPTRWRAKKLEESYYYITVLMEVGIALEDGSIEDDAMYESKNYFRTRKAAERALYMFNEILENNAIMR